MDLAEEHRILEENLWKALEEASQKTKNTLSMGENSSREQVMAIWLAMESVEYSSFMFAITYDFEDVDPATPPTKGMDLGSLMSKSAEAVEQVRLSQAAEKLANYTRLRDAVHYLRTAYLDITKRPGRTRQNLTRSKSGRKPSQGTPRVSVSNMSRRRSRSSPIPQRTHASNTS
jgi:hypothetical protein